MNKLIILLGIGVIVWGYFNFYGASFLPFMLMIISLVVVIISIKYIIKGE
jgi:hypothetical protein